MNRKIQFGSFKITRVPTQTTLQTSSATATAGASVTLTATVSASSNGNLPTGEITFFAGSKPLGPPFRVTGGVDPTTGTALARATLTTTRLPVGQDSVTAKYTGDGSYTESTSAPLVVTVTAH